MWDTHDGSDMKRSSKQRATTSDIVKHTIYLKKLTFPSLQEVMGKVNSVSSSSFSSNTVLSDPPQFLTLALSVPT